MKRIPYLTLLLAGLALTIHQSPDAIAALQWDRAGFAKGEIWRAFTGHLTHFNADHLRWDVIALLAFGSLVEFRARRAWMGCMAAGAVAISLGVLWLEPQIVVYRGLSGLDSALFAFVATDLLLEGLRTRDHPMSALGVLALAGFTAKCVFELASGHTLFVEANDAFQPMPLAHLIGALVGVVAAQARRNPDTVDRSSAGHSREHTSAC
jgi:rhomboid family GlyGly-CTERM serine protease